MIKIINGSYGHRVGKMIVAVTPGDDPIALTEKEEARLVRLGVAEYVETPADPPKEEESGKVANPAAGNGAPTDPPRVEAGKLPEYNEDMKLDELKAVAEAYGVDASALRSKKAVIEAIEEAKELPTFGAADPVV